MHVKKGDKVKVIAGKDKGLVGEIIAVYPERQKVTVQGANVITRHLRDQQGQGSNTQGGIVTYEAPIHVSNVQLVVTVDGEEVATRVGYNRVEVTKKRADGSEYSAFRSVRVARKTGEEI
ncbi:MAG TPA: 50S ribosomal protein L24 [Candidatus Avipropionibacterium avicola]|uniref:Large ribosomal subunit protein uL24 n=1 Tax=Candidatus Avipropionibacterium avicola TaxID=2840701 RepID=A0A9D1GZ01_9ACTN|nr:50S ribosomal protein L24 [Candidatus Avipropionibacterium avicola]